jgi:hypothetical protein
MNVLETERLVVRWLTSADAASRRDSMIVESVPCAKA